MFELLQPFDEAVQTAIQTGWHNPVIDAVMKFISVSNDHGEVWFLLSFALIFFKKTRKSGICVLISLGLIFLINQFGLKLMFQRPRPYNVLTQFEPLLPKLSSYSFPSGHSITSFGSAVSMTCAEQHYLNDRGKNFFMRHKLGIISLIYAALIAFSRVYLFMHWLTDVIGGALIAGILGIVISVLFIKTEPKVTAKIESKRKEK